MITTVDGTRLHAVHVRSPEPAAVPLVLLHGWPGSIVEFQRVLAPLTDPAAHGGDPADAVHLVVPSLPSCGFSGPTPDGGWSTQRMAAAIAGLVRRLGYDRYLVHGGDWGSAVARDLGVLDREHLLGLHLTMTMGLQAQDPQTDDERAAAQKARHYAAELAGYNKLQGTRPLSLAARRRSCPGGCRRVADVRSGVAQGGGGVVLVLDVQPGHCITWSPPQSWRARGPRVGLRDRAGRTAVTSPAELSPQLTP